MIAVAKRSSPSESAAVNRQFEQMLPRIRRTALRAFREKNHELREDLAAEVVARAFAAFARLAEQGRADLGYAIPLAQFAIKQAKCGRRLGARLNANDVSSRHGQLRRGVSMRRLDRYDERNGQWREVCVEDRRPTPAALAATRIDFAAWLESLPGRTRRIAMTLAAGESTQKTARKFGLSPGRISQIRRELLDSWREFVGDREKPVGAA